MIFLDSLWQKSFLWFRIFSWTFATTLPCFLLSCVPFSNLDNLRCTFARVFSPFLKNRGVSICSPSEKVAKSKKLDYVMNKEACFYIRPDLDVTTVVISEMDRSFEVDSKARKLSDNSEDLVPQINAIEETTLEKAG